MSPENAKVLIAEDNKNFVDIISRALESDGHKIEVRAFSFEEAMAAVKEAKEKGINVALVDGSLSEEFPDHSHGLKISQALKVLNIKVISISDREVDWADEICRKPFRLDELREKVWKI